MNKKKVTFCSLDKETFLNKKKKIEDNFVNKFANDEELKNKILEELKDFDFENNSLERLIDYDTRLKEKYLLETYNPR